MLAFKIQIYINHVSHLNRKNFKKNKIIQDWPSLCCYPDNSLWVCSIKLSRTQSVVQIEMHKTKIKKKTTHIPLICVILLSSFFTLCKNKPSIFTLLLACHRNHTILNTFKFRIVTKFKGTQNSRFFWKFASCSNWWHISKYSNPSWILQFSQD